LKKGITFENKKGTNVVTISYKSKDKELAYNVVSSIIKNYVQLQKELNAEKSKSDKRIIEKSYNQAKEDLKKTVDSVSGIPEQATMQTAGISVMSAFSSSAQSAMGQLRGQLIEGHKSKIAVTEEAAKVAELSKRLEWAKLVEEMSDSSKVVVLKAPRILKDYEQASPKLFTNIILGIVFGVIASLIAVIFKEVTDKKLAYSMLGDNIIYNSEKDFINLKRTLLTNQNKNVTLVAFEQLPTSLLDKLKDYKNLNMVQADISNDFVKGVEKASEVVLFASVNKTDAELYKQVKQMINEMNKNILREVLV
jgi:capsular polysaccharide biosynthesis protein